MQQLMDTHGIDPVQADILTRDATTANLFDAAFDARADEHGTELSPASIANWIVNELPRVQRDRSLDDLALTGAHLAAVIRMIERNEISSTVARDVLADVAENGGDPVAIVERGNLRQVDDAASLDPVITAVLREYDDRVQQYRAGRSGLLGFFVGQVMSRTQGRANPQKVAELLHTHLQS
jgi:glutaminyl-tRNA synthetase